MKDLTTDQVQTLASCSANREVIIKLYGRVQVQKNEHNDAQTLIENA